MSSTFSVKDLCDRFGVSEHTVLAWIAAGELKALHVGRRLGAKKPRWRVTQEALAAFELARTPTPPAPQSRRRKRQGAVIQFY